MATCCCSPSPSATSPPLRACSTPTVPFSKYPPTEQAIAIATAAFTLNRQQRQWQADAEWQGDTLRVYCNGCRYRIPRRAVTVSHQFCWLSPYRPGRDYAAQGTFLFLSLEALQQLLHEGETLYDGITWRALDHRNNLLHVRADVDNTEMWILTNADLPWIVRTKGNPLQIDWTLRFNY